MAFRRTWSSYGPPYPFGRWSKEAGLTFTLATYSRKKFGIHVLFFFFFAHFYFPAFGQAMGIGVVPSFFLPPRSCLQFSSRILVGFSNPTARRFFIEGCQLTLSRFPQVNLCARKRKSPTHTEVSVAYILPQKRNPEPEPSIIMHYGFLRVQTCAQAVGAIDLELALVRGAGTN